MAVIPLQKQLQELEDRNEILDSILSVAKTPGGHLTDHGKNLYFILRSAGMKKSAIAKILDVTPAALSKFN